MTTIDIRNVCEQQIEEIQFADEGDYYNVQFLIREDENNNVTIKANHAEPLVIESKEDAENLIKALQKAMELGWWKA